MDKLAKILSSPINSESDVSYLLAEIRKTLEAKNKSNKYPTVNFYCNWALHSRIDKITDSVKDFFIKLEKNINKCFKHYVHIERFSIIKSSVKDRKGEHKIRNLINSEVNKFISFESLRKELKKFLAKNKLPLNLVNNNSEWKIFSKYLREITTGSPLMINLHKLTPNGKIEKFYITKDLPPLFSKEFPELQKLVSSGKITSWQIWLSNSAFPMVGYLHHK